MNKRNLTQQEIEACVWIMRIHAVGEKGKEPEGFSEWCVSNYKLGWSNFAAMLDKLRGLDISLEERQLAEDLAYYHAHFDCSDFGIPIYGWEWSHIDTEDILERPAATGQFIRLYRKEYDVAFKFNAKRAEYDNPQRGCFV